MEGNVVFLFQDDDPPPRMLARDCVRRSESEESAADDGHVYLRVVQSEPENYSVLIWTAIVVNNKPRF
jgi:hypothetical protein